MRSMKIRRTEKVIFDFGVFCKPLVFISFKAAAAATTFTCTYLAVYINGPLLFAIHRRYIHTTHV